MGMPREPDGPRIMTDSRRTAAQPRIHNPWEDPVSSSSSGGGHAGAATTPPHATVNRQPDPQQPGQGDPADGSLQRTLKSRHLTMIAMFIFPEGSQSTSFNR